MEGMMKIFTLVGVALLGVTLTVANESEGSDSHERPMRVQENSDEERTLDVPEVVLQLKYDRGELNRIYLTQFRKDTKVWVPTVAARSNLCTDLCHAGLGGSVCGDTCPQLMPVGLQTALMERNQTEPLYGQPRYSVCPALCENHLGQPLCSCTVPPTENLETHSDHAVDWSAVCTAFCHDGYLPGGCPACDSSSATDSGVLSQSSRILTTYEGWTAWCNVQCRQGQGGAACNCDRTPFQ